MRVNLSKSGPSEGRKQYPNFLMYSSMNDFKAFKNAAACFFLDEERWYTDKRDIMWDAFLPILQGKNDKHASLFGKVLLMLDESMVGWQPKMTKTRGLSNIPFQPRKPVDLGLMLKTVQKH